MSDEQQTNCIDRYGLYIGLLKVHYMCDGSGAYSGGDIGILEDWILKKDRKRPKRRY